ncbi:hypothetical protein [Massilia sp. TWR1-2-2]|uniref:hypothetical protein n=1 Tax=Massilia sp. TWR1-2-2 TaxID=2804584 RepID=UPI003CE6E1E6
MFAPAAPPSAHADSASAMSDVIRRRPESKAPIIVGKAPGIDGSAGRRACVARRRAIGPGASPAQRGKGRIDGTVAGRQDRCAVALLAATVPIASHALGAAASRADVEEPN